MSKTIDRCCKLSLFLLLAGPTGCSRDLRRSDTNTAPKTEAALAGDYHGAFAHGTETSWWTGVTGMKNDSDAGQGALVKCRSVLEERGGPGDCEVVGTFFERCGGLARTLDKARKFVAGGADEGTARQAALDLCAAEAGKDNCDVRAAFCVKSR